MLEKARTSGDAIDKERTALEAANAPISHTEEHLSSLVGAVLQGREPPPALTALTARIPNNNPPMPPPRCEFSLHEVLSGYARVTRLNGEEPRQYRARLEKRLGALMILDQQLQDELLAKTEDVRRDRDRLREVTIQLISDDSSLRSQPIHPPSYILTFVFIDLPSLMYYPWCCVVLCSLDGSFAAARRIASLQL